MKSIFHIGVCVAVLGGSAALAQGREMDVIRADRGGADEGLYFLLGAGAETYTGDLAPSMATAPAYGAHVGYKPTERFGIELGYNGAVSGVQVAGTRIEDVDVVRNGVQAAATLGLTRTRFQPYLMGGVGFESHNVRGGGEALGFGDDTNGYVPAGAGLRYNIGSFFTADARVNYNFTFGQDFAPGEVNDLGDGRVQGLLQLGGIF